MESESLSLPQGSQFIVIGRVSQVTIVCMLEHLPHFLSEMGSICQFLAIFMKEIVEINTLN